MSAKEENNDDVSIALGEPNTEADLNRPPTTLDQEEHYSQSLLAQTTPLQEERNTLPTSSEQGKHGPACVNSETSSAVEEQSLPIQSSDEETKNTTIRPQADTLSSPGKGRRNRRRSRLPPCQNS